MGGLFRRQRTPHGADWEKRIAILVILGSIVLVAFAYATRPEAPAQSAADAPGETMTQAAAQTTAAAEELPECTRAPKPTQRRPVVCRTRSATLKIAVAPSELGLDALTIRSESARLQELENTPARLILDLRVTGGADFASIEGRPYVSIGGVRVDASSTGREIEGSEARRLVFALSADEAQALRDSGSVDLAVPAPEGAGPVERGILRIGVETPA